MSKDIFDNLHIDKGAFSQVIEKGHGYFTFPKLKGPLGPRMKFKEKEKIIWSINDYLGFSSHPEIMKSDAAIAAKYSMGFPMGARIMSGNLDEHEKLEQMLADFVGKESAILFNFGYPGVCSSIDAILTRSDVVIYDEEVHACIIDGVRLHLGKRMSYKHNDIEHLKVQLYKAQKITKNTGGGILIITEGVFSMRGDQGRLKDIIALKPEYGFRIFVDDAHGFGVLGKSGRGTPEAQNVMDEIDFYFATFAKAMASIGAFLASKRHVAKYLIYNTRSQVFGKALPMITTLGLIKRLELMKQNNHLRERMWNNANRLKKGLNKIGLTVGNGESPITPVYLNGSLEEMRKVLTDIRDNYNIFCTAVIYPVVPKGTILIRLVPTANHSDSDINETLFAFKMVAKKLKNGFYERSMIIN
jgi:glycine C-acetyltransferase